MTPRQGRLVGKWIVLAILVGLVMVVRWAFPSGDDSDRCQAPLPFPGSAFEGKVDWIADGDSLCVRGDDGLIEVRLADFDAPELSQPGGNQARAALRRLAQDKLARCRALHISHDRIVARCSVDGRPLGQAMRDAGITSGGN
jgi:Micrococcal nuclease (thermonuclease) homologs